MGGVRFVPIDDCVFYMFYMVFTVFTVSTTDVVMCVFAYVRMCVYVYMWCACECVLNYCMACTVNLHVPNPFVAFNSSLDGVRGCVRSVARPSRNVGMRILCAVRCSTYCGKYRPQTME